jgi:hypothetical protein
MENTSSFKSIMPLQYPKLARNSIAVGEEKIHQGGVARPADAMPD